MLICYWLLIAQIVLESFPVSSSTHVALIEFFFTNINQNIDRTSSFFCMLPAGTPINIDLLSHLAHGPTVIIVALFFYDRWTFLLVNWRRCWPIIAKIIVLTIIADTITALFFLIINRIPFPLSFFGIGMMNTIVLLISVSFCSDKYRASWSYRMAIVLGIVQAMALLPGISRMASTYAAARWLQLPAHKAFEISLLIQWPLICAAFLNSLYIVGYTQLSAQFLNLPMVFIILGSSIAAWYGLCLVYRLAIANTLWWFALYMIIPMMVWAYSMWQ